MLKLEKILYKDEKDYRKQSSCIIVKTLKSLVMLTVCSCHVTYAFESELTLGSVWPNG